MFGFDESFFSSAEEGDSELDVGGRITTYEKKNDGATDETDRHGDVFGSDFNVAGVVVRG